mmetsp:Transcript_15365/g.16112  ORF Transcript_15365/g.16112 Transcript_15365/m.16112 type:complete len:537 (+) Transcript_15365:61-1671(+)
MSNSSRRQAPGGNSTFSPGWTSESDIIKPSRKPGPINSNSSPEEDVNKVHKKPVIVDKEDNYQIGWESQAPSSPIKPARKPGPPQNESKEIPSPKKRPGTGGAASFSVGWVKPDANAKQAQVGIPVGGHSTFSVGWTGVPEAIKHSRKPPPSLSCKETTVFKGTDDSDTSSSQIKPSRKLIPQDNSDGYSISWHDEPNNQTIRPSRKPGPPSPTRAEKETIPSPTKRRVAGGEASFSVGWTTPNTQTDRFLTSHRQAPGGNSTFTTSWETSTTKSTASESNLHSEIEDDVLDFTPQVIEPVPYSIGIIVHTHSTPTTSSITETLLPVLLSALTLSGVSNTNIFIEYINSLTALPFTTQKFLSHVDGILVFSITLIDSDITPPNKLLESSIFIEVLQTISQKHNYPAIVPGFVVCQNSPESILEMKGVMKHVTKDWSTHLVTVLETINSKPPVQILTLEEYFRLNDSSKSDSNESVTESTTESDTNNSTSDSINTIQTNESNKNIAGKVTVTEPNSKVTGASKKRVTGGGASTIVLG